jgi:hypothetical protein
MEVVLRFGGSEAPVGVATQRAWDALFPRRSCTEPTVSNGGAEHGLVEDGR